MTKGDAPLFSIIVPTRGRPDGLRRLLDSFRDTTAHPNAVEVVIVVDSDDSATLAFTYGCFPLKRVVVDPGLKMGALNMAGYKASTGQFIMLLNDDVILRTHAWDEKVRAAFATFADAIALVHVNDKIFEEKLCTFPFLSRTYCEMAGGICPADYQRYRIDDHIYNVFNLLAVLGKIRILFLRDVVFEHTNFVLTAFGGAEYRPIESIHAADTELFNALLPERKALALRLMDYLDNENVRARAHVRESLLKPIHDSVALRRPEYVRIQPDGKVPSSSNTRVTIGIVSADAKSEHARTCIDLVKKFTTNFDLIILDNNCCADFNHPREMNRLLAICETEHLVLMDDDVFVDAGWLDGMLRCMTSSVGVVTPLHKDRGGRLSYAGVVMRPDYSGHHTHSFALAEAPFRIQTLCSAMMLINVAACGRLRFNEAFSKYFLDIDFGLNVWSAGLEVLCTPSVAVTHIGGATLQQGSSRSNELFELQRERFVREWVETGRYRSLEQGIWSDVPEIQALYAMTRQVEALLTAPIDRTQFEVDALALFRALRDYPVILYWAGQRIWQVLGDRAPDVSDPQFGCLAFLLGCTLHTVLIDDSTDGLNIFLYSAEFYALPKSDGVFDPNRLAQGEYGKYYQAQTLTELRSRIRGDLYEHPVKADHVQRQHESQTPWRKSFGAWKTVKSERRRLGSWSLGIRSVVKASIKRQIVRVFGVRAFLRLKDIYGRAKEVRLRRGWLPAVWLGFRLLASSLWRVLGKLSFAQSTTNNLLASEEGRIELPHADPERWLNASPVSLIESDYRGFSIHRYEYKYFAVELGTVAAFDYQEFVNGNSRPRLIGHSLGELRAVVDDFLKTNNATALPRILILAHLPARLLKPILDRNYAAGKITLLVDKSSAECWSGYPLIVLEQGTIQEWAHGQCQSTNDPIRRRLIDEKFERVVIPWSYPESWSDNSLEAAASGICDCVEVLHTSGERRLYRGENLHRLVYNKAYLASMFQVLPSPVGKTILEAGCSDGLVCDILALSGASKVVGIDVMKTVGCGFSGGRIEYRVMDMATMGFPDQSFDMAYSIATFEHLADPYHALLEMLRVTKVGGSCYIQAGPLYHSPFGHHMFGYFDDYPWIHLRKPKNEIVSFAMQRGIQDRIERDFALPCEQYVDGMLNKDHVNGLFLEDYRLGEFSARPDIEVLKFNVSREGADLLTPEIIAEIPELSPERLVEHGFEFAFRRLR